MIEVFKETTGQVGDFTYQPHHYYVEKKTGKLVAFKAAPDYDNLVEFSKPLKFDKRRRTFETIAKVNEL